MDFCTFSANHCRIFSRDFSRGTVHQPIQSSSLCDILLPCLQHLLDSALRISLNLRDSKLLFARLLWRFKCRDFLAFGHALDLRPALRPRLSRTNHRHFLSRCIANLSDNYIELHIAKSIPRIGRYAHRSISSSTPISPLNLLFTVKAKLVHEQLAFQWLGTSGSNRDNALRAGWFFLELMTKAMIEHLATTDRLNAHRRNRFSEQFHDDIMNLTSSVTQDISSRRQNDPKLVENLNSSLAFFLHDLLSVMDRGFVFSLIRSYSKDITAKATSAVDSAVISHNYFHQFHFNQFDIFDRPCGTYSSILPGLCAVMNIMWHSICHPPIRRRPQ